MANIFDYAFGLEKTFFKEQLADNGYKSFTTFYSDLTIAEVISGLKGVKETIENVKKSWLNDYKYFTEFIMAVNYKAWEMDARIKRGQTKICGNGADIVTLLDFYSKQYESLRDLFTEHYKGNSTAINYYYTTTD